MQWNAPDLAEKGFVYVKKAAEDGDFPPHVDSVRKSLLDFSWPLLDAPGFQTSSSLANYMAWSEKPNHPLLQTTRIVQQKAIDLSAPGCAEPRWSSFYEEGFFDRLALRTVSVEDKSRISHRSHFYYDAIVAEKGLTWEAFNSREARKHFTVPYCPKPDITFYLPIYDTRENSSVNVAFSASRWNPKSQPCMAEPFTWSTLHYLHFHAQLQPGTRGLSNGKPRDLTSPQLTCYPWLIVELEEGDKNTDSVSSEEAVYCRANNAAACALQLQRQLAKYDAPLVDQAHIPPIPTITAVGALVTVWIAYYKKDSTLSKTKTHHDAYVMRAIWEGDMKVAKDIIELYMLVDNIHTWAVRVFKPSVALHLNQWKDVFSQENGPAGSFHAQPYIERYREMVPRVNALWKEFKEMEFESNNFGNLISPVHFSLLLQQMVVSDHDKLLERMESLVESKIQNLCACKCSRGSTEKERSMHQVMPDAPTRNSQRAGQGTKSGTASDSDSSRSDADKLGTDTTETSQATSSPQDSSMSPSLNRPEALAASASAVKTPTQSIASPTPSTRGLHSQSPSSCHSWDTAVENPEQEPDGDDAVAEAQRLDAQKEEASVTPCTSFILLSASGSSSSAAQEGSLDDSLTTCKTSGRAALDGGAPPKVVAGDFAYRPKAMPRRRLGDPGGKPLATLFGADATAHAALTGKWLSDKFVFGDAGSRTPAKVDFTVSSKRWPPGTFFPDIVVKDATGDEGGGSDEGATAGEADSNKRPTVGEASSSK